MVEADEAAALLADLAREELGTLVLAGRALDGVVATSTCQSTSPPTATIAPRCGSRVEHLDVWRATFTRLLVADYDPWLGNLHTAAIVLGAPEEER